MFNRTNAQCSLILMVMVTGTVLCTIGTIKL